MNITQKKLLDGLHRLKMSLMNLSVEIKGMEGELSDVIENLKALSPIEKSIDKAIIKAKNKGKTIPKQSTVKQMRS